MKHSVSSADELTERINYLEQQEALQIGLLKQKFQDLKHSVAPAALIKSAYNGLRANKKVQGNILDNSAGVAAGWLVRKMYAGNSKNIFKKTSGYLLQYFATKLITKKMPAIREKIQLKD